MTLCSVKASCASRAGRSRTTSRDMDKSPSRLSVESCPRGGNWPPPVWKSTSESRRWRGDVPRQFDFHTGHHMVKHPPTRRGGTRGPREIARVFAGVPAKQLALPDPSVGTRRRRGRASPRARLTRPRSQRAPRPRLVVSWHPLRRPRPTVLRRRWNGHILTPTPRYTSELKHIAPRRRNWPRA